MNERIEFLKQVPPFDLLSVEVLTEIEEKILEVTFKRKEIIYQQHKTKLAGLDLILEGICSAFFYNSDGRKENEVELNPKDTYGAFSILLNQGKSIKTVIAIDSGKFYRIPSDLFRQLCSDHDDFYQFFLTAFGREMLNERFANFISQPPTDLDSLSLDRYFVRRLDTLPTRPLISCEWKTPCHDAARLMETHKMSCLFIEEDDQYIGYVTDIVLRNRVVAEQRHSATPVGEIMETPIFTISTRAFVHEAVLLMFTHNIRYLVVEHDEKVQGVISRTKLLSDQAQSPFVFIQSVRLALSVEELKEKWTQVPEVINTLINRGVKAELVNQVITNISDSISQKVIEGVIQEIGSPPARFVFMSLGSEGRMEQTLKTDQDNAIIYEDKANEFRAKTRKYFLRFAEMVSERLDQIGFAFCTGGFMAKNPKWTHSLSHWKRNYNTWIDHPDPQSVMNFSTFFDCRGIFGDMSLIEELQKHILEKLEDPGQSFFAQLAQNALQYEPPLTFFKGIKTISKGEKQVFNIKRAMTPIVDLVRVYALKHKILKTNTGERMMALQEEKVFTREDFSELMQSYYYLMSMRLRYQSLQIIHDHDEPHNFVSPGSLTKIEVVTLKEIFKVIENFQQRIRMVFTRNLLG